MPHPSSMPPNSRTANHERARQDACAAAIDAWRAIRPAYHAADYRVTQKPDGPATDADRLADRLIAERLRQAYPPAEYGYLTEESLDDPTRLLRERVWIIDPIDGTKDFISRSGNFAIHIGLVERLADEPWRPVAAAVYWPVAGKMYSAARGAGAWRHDLPPEATEAPAGWNPAAATRLQVDRARAELPRMRSVVSNSNRNSRLVRFIESLDLEGYWHVGSLGIKLCSIAEGSAELYVNLSRGMAKEWDSCAPHLILEEAGGTLTGLNGEEITYNREDPKLYEGLLASNSVIHNELLARVQEFKT